jgi:hypothetical protein
MMIKRGEKEEKREEKEKAFREFWLFNQVENASLNLPDFDLTLA